MFWPLGAGAAWEKIRSRSRLKKKSGAEAGADEKICRLPSPDFEGLKGEETLIEVSNQI